MNWVRAGAAFAAIGVHVAIVGVFIFSSSDERDSKAIQSGAGKDDLTIVATVTMQTEESIGPDKESAAPRDASAAGEMTAPPKLEQETKPDPENKPDDKKMEEAVKMEPPPLEEAPVPAPPPDEKRPEKNDDLAEPKIQPSNPGVPVEAQDEKSAESRNLEARRSQALSIYNGKIYQAVIRHAQRPKTVQKGRVVIALTLAPSGDILARSVVESSGSETLDKTAITSLERAAPFPPAPPELSKEPYTLRVPFEYAVK
jgi:protein TonB